ncbi:MAG: molybdate ABC transporter permease subunit, partial [Nocardioides kribbensis]
MTSTPVLERPASPKGRRPRRVRRTTPRSTLTRGAGLGLGIAMLWFSILVLLPLSAVVAAAAEGGWGRYLSVLQNDQTWAAVTLTVSQAVLVTLVNVVVGTVIAWVLVRDRFWGKRALDVVIDV